MKQNDQKKFFQTRLTTVENFYIVHEVSSISKFGVYFFKTELGSSAKTNKSFMVGKGLKLSKIAKILI